VFKKTLSAGTIASAKQAIFDRVTITQP